ncbi:M13 family metallopeptidase [soil metagenome]
MFRIALTISLALVVLACQTKSNNDKPDVLLINIDSVTRPQDDFFQYANGGWIKKNPIPLSETHWGIGDLVQEEIYSRLIKINETASGNNSSDLTQQMIGNFWRTGMDTIKIEQEKLTPLQTLLDQVADVKDVKSLMRTAAILKIKGVSCFLNEYVGQDDKKSDVMAYFLHQGGIGLPDRDYYFNKDERSSAIRKEYKNHLIRMFIISGSDSIKAIKQAEHVVNIETGLANASRKLEDLRDPYKNYNKFAKSDLNKLSSSFDWKQWMDIGKVSNIDSVIIGQPEFFTALDKFLKKEPIENWRDYMTWRVLHSYAPYMHKEMVNENFQFYGKILRGAEKIRPRWKRILDQEEDAIGEVLGQLFVKEYFNENSKKRYIALVEAIRDALKERIKNLDWMSDSTKQKAYLKLATIRKKVGYPDKWKDFSSLKIDTGSYVLNVIRANQWWSDYSFDKLGKPVDRNEWYMTPQTYNAYYNPSNNEIVLPAGIFTIPGFRDEDVDDAVVYGYGGASTIGHEITHGFDDQGRKYNAEGNLTEWWSRGDEDKFNKRAAVMVSQFNNYIPVDSAHINGSATLGENIADLGGVLLGFDAFKKTEQFKKGEKIAGMTPTERYFLGYSLSWLGHERREALANQLLTDVHSPSKYRVNGPIVNVEEFYTTFGIKSGDPMFRPDSIRVRIW